MEFRRHWNEKTVVCAEMLISEKSAVVFFSELYFIDHLGDIVEQLGESTYCHFCVFALNVFLLVKT